MFNFLNEYFCKYKPYVLSTNIIFFGLIDVQKGHSIRQLICVKQEIKS